MGARGRRVRMAGAALTGLMVALHPGPAPAASRVTLVTTDGVVIAGTYYEPARQPAPMVVLLHMATRNRGDWTEVAGRLAARGVGALAIDLRGHGDSGAGVSGDLSAPADESVAVRDVHAALAWLKARRESLPGRVGVVGASLGANLAVLAAADDPTVRALVLLSATLDYRGVRTEAALRKYGERPALLVASQEDGYATRSARQLGGQGTGVRDVQVLEAAGHGTMMLRRRPDLLGVLVDWLCLRLL